MPSILFTSVGRVKDTRKEIEEAIASIRYEASRERDEERKRNLLQEASDLHYAQWAFPKKSGRGK